MSPGAVVFMLVSWALVLGLTGWAFWRVLSRPTDAAPPPRAEPSPGTLDGTDASPAGLGGSGEEGSSHHGTRRRDV